MPPSRIEPDTKDWTWVLDAPCPECAYVAGSVEVSDLGRRIRDNATAWSTVLTDADVRARPVPEVWSPLEYACHVRDVHTIFAQRVRSMLDLEAPGFADWDQDASALAGRYAEQDPAVVAAELAGAAGAVADLYDAVPADAWGRRGLRSNGSEFTVASIGRYHLHDVVHHLHDVRRGAQRATLAAYDAHAAAYRDGAEALDDAMRTRREVFAGALPPGSRVLEVGSGPGRDAVALEALGLSVRRTDVSRAFVALIRAEGHEADVVDPLHDDLTDPQRPGSAYDGVWANACLLHVARADLPVVLSRLAAATRPGGALHLSLKEGDGEAWSTHGSVPVPRRFVYWREEPLRTVLGESGWAVGSVAHGDSGRGERWLEVSARRV